MTAKIERTNSIQLNREIAILSYSLLATGLGSTIKAQIRHDIAWKKKQGRRNAIMQKLWRIRMCAVFCSSSHGPLTFIKDDILHLYLIRSKGA